MAVQVIAADIGGTHARFAVADIADGRVVRLGAEAVYKSGEYASFQTAWQAFAATLPAPPRAAAIAIAAPIHGDVIKLTNNPWIFRPALIAEKLAVERHVLINDFAAVGHAVAQAGAEHFHHLCGPDAPLPPAGVISIVGPGTGLGVAQLWRDGSAVRVQPTEGGHIDFAPLDSIEDAILAHLRRRHPRVSVERIVSGPGLVDIYAALAALEGRTVAVLDDRALWTLALAGEDALAVAALDRFCLSLGSAAGDFALAHGAGGVVIAGGLGLRLRDRLVGSGFAERFTAKGRFAPLMASLPVKLITHPQPGLFGAAAAFAAEFG